MSVIVSVLLISAPSTALKPASPTLDIYLVDVEGGNATLVVAPAKESLLIDTGHLNAPVRDAGRIMDALKDAGVTNIDHLITTHWHFDHFGGMAELASRIPIQEFIDHGSTIQPHPKVDEFLRRTYPLLYKKARHIVAKPGDTIPLTDLEVKVVTAAGQAINSPLPGAGTPNPYCVDSTRPNPDPTENSQSIGIHLKFGQFRAIHLGDLSADKEFDLMCPNNRIGSVDLFIVSHHGQSNSNTPVLVHPIQSRAAIMNNGLHKGGEPEVMKVIYTAPGLENLWQLHFSQLSGQEYTAPGIFIANTSDMPQSVMPIAPIPKPSPGTVQQPELTHNGKAYWIKVSAKADGSFTVTNSRTQFSKTYPPR
jgi:beta-lactamase superfamily II metal-dependent hydrolase